MKLEKPLEGNKAWLSLAKVLKGNLSADGFQEMYSLIIQTAIINMIKTMIIQGVKLLHTHYNYGLINAGNNGILQK